MLGTTVGGKYQIERLLGEGGMGAVYSAVHIGTNRRVALKVILGDGARHSPDVIARFVREAKAAGAIDTQHIVQVLDFGVDEEQGVPYLAMEFLAGEDLDHLMERLGPLSPELAIRIVGQACLGLQKAHDAGVVHRDIKPANLYLARRDGGEIVVKILDFGIAKVKLDNLGGSEDQKLTRTGSVLGSPLYMSPEQAKGLRTIDHRTDIWSLGAVLYQALSGRTPHHDSETLGQLILSICTRLPPPIQDFATWVPPELAAVVRGSLTPEVEQRFQSAPALLEALRALQPQGFSLHESMLLPLPPAQRARVAPRLEPLGAITASDQGGPPSAVPAGSFGGTQQSLARTTKPGSKSTAPLLLVAGVVLAAGGGAAYWGLLQRQVGDAQSLASASTLVTPETTPSVPTATPSAVPTAAQSAAPAAERTVELAVGPRGVVVQVDGTPVETKNGVIALRGTLGSTRKVLLRLGEQQLTRDVAITEGGALPDKLELGALRVGRPSASKPATTGAARPAVAAPAPATKPTAKPSGLDRNFE